LADNHRMWCEAVAATDDGGCIVGGMLDGIYQTWLLKLTADGNRVWFRMFPEDFLLDGATSIEQTKDQGFFISGWGWDSTRGTCHGMARTDSFGREVWSRTFIESRGFGYGGAATRGGYIAVGDGRGPVDRREANRLAVAGQPPWGYYNMLNGPYWRVTDELQSYAKRGLADAPRCDAAYLVKIDPDGQLDWWHYYRPRNHQTRAFGAGFTETDCCWTTLDQSLITITSELSIGMAVSCSASCFAPSSSLMRNRTLPLEIPCRKGFQTSVRMSPAARRSTMMPWLIPPSQSLACMSSRALSLTCGQTLAGFHCGPCTSHCTLTSAGADAGTR